MAEPLLLLSPYYRYGGQGGETTLLKSHSSGVAEAGFDPRQVSPESLL